MVSARRIRRKASRGSVLACCRKTCLGRFTAVGGESTPASLRPLLCQGFSSKPPEAVGLFDSLTLVSIGDISYAEPLPEATQVLGWWNLFTCSLSLSHPVYIPLCMLLKAHTETRKGHWVAVSIILCLTTFYCCISSSDLGVGAFGYLHDRALA